MLPDEEHGGEPQRRPEPRPEGGAVAEGGQQENCADVQAGGEAQGRTDPQPVAPRAGFLTVGANPFGTVYIDGLEIRDTPLFKYELRPGRYVIEIQRVGYQTMVDTVSLTSGNTTQLNKTLIRIP